MLLKINSQKVIHVGSVMILPEEAKHVDDSLSTAPAVAALISRKALAVVKAPAKETAGEEPGSGVPEAGPGHPGGRHQGDPGRENPGRHRRVRRASYG